MADTAYAPLDDALAILAPYAPDRKGGLTNHAPMVAEALCAMNRPDAVLPWVEGYRKQLQRRAPSAAPIAAGAWHGALGVPERHADWRALMATELAAAPWRTVLDRWVARLAPGLSAAATHGIIRVGHAVRALAREETPARRNELADALAYWASTYTELPTGAPMGRPSRTAADAIAHVPLIPEGQQPRRGSIIQALAALRALPAFPDVIHRLDVRGDPAEELWTLSELFARVYLANARDPLTVIVFIHGVTSLAALDLIVPHVQPATARTALPYAWQAAAGLYAAYGVRQPEHEAVPAPSISEEALIARTVAGGDEHAIKMTEACLRQHARRAAPAFLAAAEHATAALGG